MIKITKYVILVQGSETRRIIIMFINDPSYYNIHYHILIYTVEYVDWLHSLLKHNMIFISINICTSLDLKMGLLATQHQSWGCPKVRQICEKRIVLCCFWRNVSENCQDLEWNFRIRSLFLSPWICNLGRNLVWEIMTC